MAASGIGVEGPTFFRQSQRATETMSAWLAASNDLESIRVAQQRLVWGFWDREAGEKQRQNWRPFIRKFNSIRPFDTIVFQIARTGGIHGLGIVKSTHFDDETPIWPKEIAQHRVLFPWRVELALMLFSEQSLLTNFVKIAGYLDGYGIGEFPRHEVDNLVSTIGRQIPLNL